MKKLIMKFGGAIFFYSVIVGMILMMNYRFGKLNAMDTEEKEVICIIENN